jgi:hypothetical protein
MHKLSEISESLGARPSTGWLRSFCGDVIQQHRRNVIGDRPVSLGGQTAQLVAGFVIHPDIDEIQLLSRCRHTVIVCTQADASSALA